MSLKKNNTQKNRKFFQKNIYLKAYLLGFGLSFLFVPFFVYAQTKYSQDLFGLFEYAKDIIDDLVLWLFTTGAVLIFLGVLSYRLYQLSQGENISGTNKFIFYGLIALTLMFTFYAVTSLIAVTFGIQIGIPQFYRDQETLSPGSGYVDPSYSVIR